MIEDLRNKTCKSSSDIKLPAHGTCVNVDVDERETLCIEGLFVMGGKDLNSSWPTVGTVNKPGSCFTLHKVSHLILCFAVGGWAPYLNFI